MFLLRGLCPWRLANNEPWVDDWSRMEACIVDRKKRSRLTIPVDRLALLLLLLLLRLRRFRPWLWQLMPCPLLCRRLL